MTMPTFFMSLCPLLFHSYRPLRTPPSPGVPSLSPLSFSSFNTHFSSLLLSFSSISIHGMLPMASRASIIYFRFFIPPLSPYDSLPQKNLHRLFIISPSSLPSSSSFLSSFLSNNLFGSSTKQQHTTNCPHHSPYVSE